MDALAPRDDDSYRALFERIPVGIYRTTPDGRIVDANPALVQLAGFPSREAVLATPLDEIWAEPAERRRWQALMARDGTVRDFEFLHRRHDGSVIRVRETARAIRGPDGEVVAYEGMVEDVTQQKRAEEAQRFLAAAGSILASSLDDAATLADVARLAVPTLADWCLVDVLGDDGAYRRVATAHVDPERERAMREGMGCPPSASGTGITAQVIRTGRPWFSPEVSAADLDGLSPVPALQRLLRHLGIRSGIVVPLVAQGRTVGVIRLATAGARRLGPDDLRLAEELGRLAALAVENARLYRQAQHAVQAREQVLRVVSHDLRNPLSAIVAHADMLQTEGAADPEHRRAWGRIIRSAADHMNRMIRDLIDVANLEAGRLSMEPEPCAARLLVAEAVAMLRPLASARSLHLSGDAADDLPRVLADRERVLQVLSNLVGNALRFSAPGGRIEVRAEAAAGEVRFTVTDTGPGVARDDAERIFEPFQRGRRAPRGDGLGLGLSIARRIVEAHRGRVWVESRPGGGSAFHFTLPAAAVDGRAAA
ncbi:MAG TPA: ATP-binding protein [Longimicrobiaceae bacterium]|nr:ATP-binding protein [Longimicrobiaceae bacterium]